MFVILHPIVILTPNIVKGGRVLMGNSLPFSERSIKMLPPSYFSVDDDAFVNSDTLLTPWSGRGLTIFQDSFNYLYLLCVKRLKGLLEYLYGAGEFSIDL